MHDHSGVLVLNKPTGLTSRAALDRVVDLLPQVRMGHAGTLDPMASGVLVVCLGRATRLVSYVQRMPKRYAAKMQFGQRSITHDLESPLEAVNVACPPDKATVKKTIESFLGAISQLPPQYSAVHVAGRRAYELARQGKHAAIQPRTVHVHYLMCTQFDYPHATLEIACGSGTYIRSLVRDIGEQLTCGAVLTSLARTAIGNFHIDDAIAIDQLSAAELSRRKLPMRRAVDGLEVVCAPSDFYNDIAHGRSVSIETNLPLETEVLLCDDGGELLAVARVKEPTVVHPHIVLCDRIG